ncbi:MAG: hypothetical protein IJX94_01200 [Clostridia bacterium]|nr:hypothetical protein [Clostridia bacterium]
MTPEALTYSQRIHKEYCEEHPNYFACGSRSVPTLVKKAEEEAAQILKEFSVFYRGDIGIKIEPKFHELCYSITATLTVNGEPVMTEDPCDLLFLHLNEIMLNRMIQLGFTRQKGGNT